MTRSQCAKPYRLHALGGTFGSADEPHRSSPPIGRDPYRSRSGSLAIHAWCKRGLQCFSVRSAFGSEVTPFVHPHLPLPERSPPTRARTHAPVAAQPPCCAATRSHSTNTNTFQLQRTGAGLRNSRQTIPRVRVRSQTIQSLQLKMEQIADAQDKTAYRSESVHLF